MPERTAIPGLGLYFDCLRSKHQGMESGHQTLGYLSNGSQIQPCHLHSWNWGSFASSTRSPSIVFSICSSARWKAMDQHFKLSREFQTKLRLFENLRPVSSLVHSKGSWISELATVLGGSLRRQHGLPRTRQIFPLSILQQLPAFRRMGFLWILLDLPTGPCLRLSRDVSF